MSFEADVVQILRSGNKRENKTAFPDEAWPLYDSMTKAGCHLESEILGTGLACVTINNGEKDISIRNCTSGPTVQRSMIDMMIGEPWKEK